MKKKQKPVADKDNDDNELDEAEDNGDNEVVEWGYDVNEEESEGEDGAGDWTPH